MPIVAVRTISEDDRWHVIEGLAVPFGGPFSGRDSYGTFFSKNTDLGLATRTDVGIPIPLWYHHGLDPDFRFDTIGSATPVRTDDDGVWVQAQIDKRHRYYETRVKPLLEANAVGLSGGSAEHSQKIAARTGEVLAYPLHEISLTPTEANPNAVIAVRADEIERIVRAFRAENAKGEAVGPPEGGKARDDIPAEDFAGPDKSYPIVTPRSVAKAAQAIGRADDPDAVKAKIISIAKRKGAAFVAQLPKAWTEGDDAARSAAFRAWCQAAMDAGRGAQIMAELLSLVSEESDEPDQVEMLQKAIDSLSDWITAERAEIEQPDEDDIVDALTDLANLASQTAADLAVPVAVAAFIEPAVRAGRRNSAADQERISSIGEHASAITAHVSALTTSDSQPGSDDDADDAARSGEGAAQPAGQFVAAVRSHPDPYERLKADAERAGRERALELLQRQ